MSPNPWHRSLVSLSIVCILALLFAMGAPLAAGGTAEAADSPPVTPSYISHPGNWNAMSAADPKHIWAVDYFGGIWFSSDHVHWTAQTVPDSVTGSLNGVYALDADNVWAVGDDGVILKTTNGGTTWNLVSTGVTNVSQLNFMGVFALDATHVWVAGSTSIVGDSDNAAILYYNGTTWARQMSNANHPLNCVWASSPTNIWVVGDAGEILHSTNGTTWFAVQSDLTTHDLMGLDGVDSSHVWAVGGDGTILFYNGTIWATQSSGTGQHLRTVAPYDATHVWAGAGPYVLFFDGSSWSTVMYSGEGMPFVGSYAVDEDDVIVMDDDGRLITYFSSAPLQLLTPTAHEVINAGSTYKITWHRPANVAKCKLMLSYDGGTTWAVLAADAKNVAFGSYDWTVPTPNGNKTNVKIKVVGLRANGTVVASKVSGAFTIQMLTVTAPVKYDNWMAGNSHTITWSTYGSKTPAKVKLMYSKNNGLTWVNITTFKGSNPGTYDWFVPPTLSSSKMLVKVIFLNSAGVPFATAKSGVFSVFHF